MSKQPKLKRPARIQISPQDIITAEENRAKQFSALLPKKRIKPAKTKPPVYQQKKLLSEVQKSRDIAMQKQANKNATNSAATSTRINMLNAKYDTRAAG